MKVILTGLMGVSLVVGTQTVKADLLTYDGFDYPVGETLDGKDGGTGWDGVSWGQFLGGAAGLDIVADSLADPTSTLATSGNHVQTNSTQFSGRYPLLPGYGDDGTTTYYSILLRPDADLDPEADDYYGLQLFSNAGADLFIGKGGAMTNYGLEAANFGFDDESSVTPTIGETVLLVVRIDFTDFDDDFDLYVNPTPGDPEPAVADASLFFDLGNQNGLAFNTGGGAQVSFDEIRIGETFADVMPVETSIPGDFNGDGVVDGNDFLAWQEGFGTIYDGNDFLIWQENFDPGGGSGSVVPEPTSFTLLLLALVGAAFGTRRR